MNTDEELHSKARENIVALMEKTGQPLTEMQQVTLAGALAVWITKAQQDGYSAAIDFVACGG